jgi:hypothetical protein
MVLVIVQEPAHALPIVKIKQTIRQIFAKAEKEARRERETEALTSPTDVPPPRPGCSTYKRYDGATVYVNCR